jgi:DNA-binding NarL/FixJ family response regulator
MNRPIIEDIVNPDTSTAQITTLFMVANQDIYVDGLTRIIVFGHEIADTFIRRMISAGAHGFIDSNTSPKLLGVAINEVRDGGYWLGSLRSAIAAS